METMRELLAVFMLTKASENVLFYRSQGNAARVGLTGPTGFGIRAGPCRASFPNRNRVRKSAALKTGHLQSVRNTEIFHF